MWHGTKIKTLRTRIYSHLCIHCIIHKTSPILPGCVIPNVHYCTSSFQSTYLSRPKKNCLSQSSGIGQQGFSTVQKLPSARFSLNCPCLPVTQLDWAGAVTRDLNEVVNFELTPFRVTDDVNMCSEFGWAAYCRRSGRVTSDMRNTS